MDWDMDNTGVRRHDGQRLMMNPRGPTTTVVSAVSNAPIPSTTGMIFNTTAPSYCLQTQAPFGLMTPSSYPPQIILNNPGLAISPPDSYFPQTTLAQDHSSYWLDPIPATDAGQGSLFPFQQDTQPAPAGTRLAQSNPNPHYLVTPPTATHVVVGPLSPTFTSTGSPPAFTTAGSSPTLAAENSSSASWSPSPPPPRPPPHSKKMRERNTQMMVTMTPTVPNNNKNNNNHNQTNPGPTARKSTKSSSSVPTKTSSKKIGEPGSRRPKGQLNPSNFDTLEEYQTELRLWHNRIGKKYRNKLNSQFESLYSVLHPDQDDDDDDDDDDNSNSNSNTKSHQHHMPVRGGRVINKARTLDLARQRILDLTHENNNLKGEVEQLLRMLESQKKG